MRKIFPGVLAAALAACAGPPLQPPAPHPDVELDLGPAALPGALGMLTGFDPVIAERHWRVGDRILLGLRLQDGDQQRHWLVLLSVTQVALQRVTEDGETVPEEVTWTVPIRGQGDQDFTSELMAVRVLVADGEGKPLGESMVKVPRQLLEKGFARVCAASEQGPPIFAFDPYSTPETEDKRPHAEAVLSLVALLGIVQEDPILASMLWEVVEPPSWFSVLWRFGVTVTLKVRFHEAVRAANGPPHLPDTGPLWWVPLSLLVNDSPALFCELMVTAPGAPLSLCGGIVGIHARHPSRADLRFSMALLSARRGEEGTPEPGRHRAFAEAPSEGRR